MKKLFLPLIILFVLCLCGCTPGGAWPYNLGVWQFPSKIKINEDIVFTAYTRVDLYENPWCITFEGLPEDVTIESGEKSDKFSTKEILCVKTQLEKGCDASGPKLDMEASVRCRYDTAGEYTIKINAFPDNGQDVAEKYYPQESFTYTITVTE